MTQRVSCTTCQSADKLLEQFIANLSMETAFHRMESQEIKCGFGLQGVCCRLCTNGPCRVTPDSPKGVCGATADVMATRNFLRSVAAGSGCYIHVVENTVRNLKNAALIKGELKGKKALDRLCGMLGISGTDEYDKAVKVADAILADLYKPDFEVMELTQKLAYAPRYKLWKKLDILPRGAKSEVFAGTVKSSTNLNSDPVDMLLHCLRLGISTGLYGLTLTSLLSDVLLGEPEIRTASVGLRVIDPEYINIMFTGHQQSMSAYLQTRLSDEDVIAKARKAGAKGFKVVGCTCVGQDFQLRGAHCTDICNGHGGNNFTSEAILATGAIDAVLTDFNCTLPGIEPICDALQIKQICIDVIAKKANAKLINLSFDASSISTDFSFDPRAISTENILDEVIAAYKARRGSVPLNLLPKHGNDTTITGLSEASLKSFLGNSWQPLIKLIASGQIKGLAAVLGCSNLTAGGGHDILTVDLTKELIARDILVLTAGCSSGGIENCGLMSPEAANLAGPKLKAVCQKLGIPPVLNFGPCLSIGRLEIISAEIADALNIDIPELPLVLSAPQWLEEQALADGAFGLALGLPVHLGQAPFVVGSPIAVKVLCEDMKSLTGGQIIINGDAIESAALLEDIIIQKRKGLNL